MNRTKNHLSVRIESVEVMKMMDSLSKRKDAYKSKNEIINRALEMAIPELYNAVFEKKVKKTTQESKEIEEKKDLVAIKNMVGQLSIQLNMIEYLATFLYNAVAAKAEGIDITKEYIESGVLEQLPENLAEVKREMTKVEYQRRNKK